MKEFSWRTHEYVHIENNPDWFWVLGILATAFIITSLIFGNILFALLLGIATFFIIVIKQRKPKEIEIKITDRGISIDGMMYPYRTIQSFWVDEDHKHGPRLIIELEKFIAPHLFILLEDSSQNIVKDMLLLRIPEKPYEDSAFELILEKLGF